MIYTSHINPGLGVRVVPLLTQMFFKCEEMHFFNTQKSATWKINFQSNFRIVSQWSKMFLLFALPGPESVICICQGGSVFDSSFTLSTSWQEWTLDWRGKETNKKKNINMHTTPSKHMLLSCNLSNPMVLFWQWQKVPNIPCHSFHFLCFSSCPFQIFLKKRPQSQWGHPHQTDNRQGELFSCKG